MYNPDKGNFLDYIHNPMSKESIQVLYSANNIILEKCELYGDFVQSLLGLGFDTYMGDDVTSLNEQIKHFRWCWNTNSDNFKREGLSFESEKLYDYFLEFMIEVYYTSLEKNQLDDVHQVLLSLWHSVFQYDNLKTHSDMDTLVEIYKLFDKSFKTIDFLN